MCHCFNFYENKSIFLFCSWSKITVHYNFSLVIHKVIYSVWTPGRGSSQLVSSSLSYIYTETPGKPAPLLCTPTLVLFLFSPLTVLVLWPGYCDWYNYYRCCCLWVWISPLCLLSPERSECRNEKYVHSYFDVNIQKHHWMHKECNYYRDWENTSTCTLSVVSPAVVSESEVWQLTLTSNPWLWPCESRYRKFDGFFFRGRPFRLGAEDREKDNNQSIILVRKCK